MSSYTGKDYTKTNTYANLTDGYNAGTNNDEQSRDRIIAKGNESLYQDCKDRRLLTNKVYDDTYVKLKNEDTASLFNIYKNDVEFVNSFQEQVRVDEKAYFEKRYGPKVYAYLIEKRRGFNEYNDSLGPNADPNKCNNKDISGNKIIYKVDEKKQDQDFKNLYDKLSHFFPSVDATTTYRKIEYRDKEHEILMLANTIINAIYYSLFFFMVILLASSNRLLFKKRFLIYLFLLILPFLYPYVFMFFKNIFTRMFNEKPSHGPKNAFIETPPPNIDGYAM